MTIKRIFDLIVSFTALVLLSPVIAFLYVLIRIKMGAPVIFRQERPGLNAKPFQMIKYRTMLNQFDSNNQPLPDEVRLTSLGKFLRKSSLDELPELFNVLKGEMSLVGPRPLLIEYLPLYNTQQRRRHEVRPGITGLAQVSGRNELEWDKRFELDVWYVDNRSFWLDLKILLWTVAKVLKSEGISQHGQVTMKKFTGKEHDSL